MGIPINTAYIAKRRGLAHVGINYFNGINLNICQVQALFTKFLAFVIGDNHPIFPINNENRKFAIYNAGSVGPVARIDTVSPHPRRSQPLVGVPGQN